MELSGTLGKCRELGRTALAWYALMQRNKDAKPSLHSLRTRALTLLKQATTW
jgi:hypothetical protein